MPEGTPVPSFFVGVVDQQHIRPLIDDVLSGYPDLFLVDFKIKGAVSNQKLLVFIDGDNGFSIDQCSKVSRQLAEVLEQQDIFMQKYTLEVSSPGIDFPITLPRQYARNKGRLMTLFLKDGAQLRGKIEEVADQELVINTGSQRKTLSLQELEKATVEISFK